MVGAFHREKVVSGLSWKIQVPSYAGIFGISVAIAYGTTTLIKQSVHIPTGQEIATDVVARLKPKPKITPPDPLYAAPTGPLVRFDGSAVPASLSMCQGMPDAAQIDCLCPSPLDYSLKALPTPRDNNYSTEIDIKKVDRPIYRLRIFSRTFFGSHGAFQLFPPMNHSSAFLGELEYDRYSYILSSTAPEDEFKLEVHTSEGLRLKCINQDNPQGKMPGAVF